jgi:SAM-dependent methyltransferase
LAFKTYPEFQRNYGDFHFGADYSSLAIPVPGKETGKVRGDIVKFLRDFNTPVTRLLLAGERNSVKPVFAEICRISEGQIATAGLHENMDFQWNYENDPPASIGRFDCIVSQAMLEHLLDPLKHVRDCAGLLNSGGHMIFHSVLPGFIYHRHPVDCLRFFPDWFEEVAKRLHLVIQDKYIGDGHIIYVYRK